MKLPRLSLVAIAGAVTLLLSGMFLAPRESAAMPEFAQATGLQCSACHTIVPSLNAYGRYVQRTGYAAVPRESLAKTFPVWIGESLNYDSTTASNGNGKPFDAGNLAIHAIGYAVPDVTYHIQQWISQSSAPGTLDTAWIAYNHVFSPDVHLFVGKILNPAPSPYSQTSDLDGPAASSTLVGAHDWAATYGNRWGAKVAYTGKGLDVEAGYYLMGEDLNGISDFSPGDKTFQWKVALAQVKSPLEVGMFGSIGSIGSNPANMNVPVILTGDGTDRYNSTAGYLQLDPGKNYRPGAFVVYQRQSDSNPGAFDLNGNPIGPVSTYGWSAEISELLLRGNVMLSYRHDVNNSGVTGGFANGNSLNLAFNVPIPKFPYVHGYLEANLGGSSALAGVSGGPTWKGMLWVTVPVVLHP